MKIITNNVPRDVLHAFDLTEKERGQFDYLAPNGWAADTDVGAFFRYRGEVYDLNEFMVWDKPESLTRQNWDGFRSDSFFSGLGVRYIDDCERVIVGLALC